MRSEALYHQGNKNPLKLFDCPMVKTDQLEEASSVAGRVIY